MIEETKQQAADRLFNHYRDWFGRTTLYKADIEQTGLGKFDNENPNLFDGLTGILLAVNHLPLERYAKWGQASLQNVLVYDDLDFAIQGLYGRHPQQFTTTNTVSRDEYNGIAYKCSVIQPLRDTVMNDIIQYGERYKWCFADTHPRYEVNLFNPVTMFKLINAALNKDRTNQDAYVLSHVTQPDEMGFYKIISSKHEPTLFELLFAAVSFYLTSKKEKEDTSGKIMAWAKFKAMHLVGFKHPLITFSEKLFVKNMKKMYGENYVHELFKIYYKDVNHPFHTLTYGLQ